MKLLTEKNVESCFSSLVNMFRKAATGFISPSLEAESSVLTGLFFLEFLWFWATLSKTIPELIEDLLLVSDES